MSGELILFVDDEPNIVQLARMYLEREGFRVQVVGDGGTAKEAAERFNPALMVLDIMLPKLDGLEICRRLRAQEFDLLLVLAEHKGLVLKREQLLEKAWGYDYYGLSRTVDVHLGCLRRMLADSSVRIETVTGVGNKLVV